MEAKNPVMVLVNEPRAVALLRKAFDEGRLGAIVHVVDEEANPNAVDEASSVMALCQRFTGIAPWILETSTTKVGGLAWKMQIAEGAWEKGISEVWWLGETTILQLADGRQIPFTNPTPLSSERGLK